MTFKYSFNFFHEILTQDSTQDMDSLDVYSLFSNIPSAETNNIYFSRTFPLNPQSLVNEISKNESRDLLSFLTKESFFSFNNKFYTQSSGVAMKSPLVSIMANIFISHFE